MTKHSKESTSRAEPRTFRLPIWLIVVGATALLTHSATCLVGDTENLSPDEQEYVALAKSIVDDGRFVLPSGDAAKRMPLYPAFLAVFYATQEAKHWQAAALICQSILAIFSTIGIAAIAGRLCDARAALVGGIIAALYAPFLHVQTMLLTECLAMFLLVSAVWLYVAKCLGDTSRGEARIAPWIVSILLGLSILTRANAVLLLVPFVLHACLYRPIGSKRRLRIVALLLPAGLMTGGWMARNQSTVGSFTLSTIGGLNFYLGHNAEYASNPGMSGSAYGRFDELRQSGLGEAEADRRLYNDGMQFIREHPRETMANFGRKLKVWFTPTTQSFGPSIWLLVIGFMAAAYWRRGARDQRPPLRRWLVAIAISLALLAYFAWCNSEGYLPLASAIFLLPLGIPCLLIAPMPHQTKCLLMGIVLSQLAVALLYIPLSRLRWSIDAIFMIAVAIACSQLCSLIDGHNGDMSNSTKTSPGK